MRREKEADGEHVTVVIRDHGPGVPKDSLERIFEPFYRVADDRARGSGGTGIGLAIAARAVELHGGRIEAKNVDRGLEVQLRFPVNRG